MKDEGIFGGNQAMLRVLDPVAESKPAERDQPLRALEALDKLRVALVWSGHAATTKFWPVLEHAIGDRFQPREVRRFYKPSTWNAASAKEIEEIVREADYAIVGVGA